MTTASVSGSAARRGSGTSGTKQQTKKTGKAAAAAASAAKPLTLTELREAIPKECFVKSVPTSLLYMARDGGLFLALGAAMYTALHSTWWTTLSPLVSGAILMAYWMATGFIMWCMFVVGHDCGHTSFSDSWLLNTVCGHIMHAPLMVPFYAWADSHRQHHQYHNHYDRDMSFPWFTQEYRDSQPSARVVDGIRMTFPFSGFAIYLAGLPDGGHWLPFGGRLWSNASLKRYMRGIVSALSVFAWGYFVLAVVSQWDNWFAFRIYAGCWFWFSFWLVTVTYLQHHDEHTTVYTNEDWTFLRGAFLTIDREYGAGIDDFHHNITDCHLVHHLFFTQIPHYHLKKATIALRQFLANRGIGHLYRYRRQHDFFLAIWKTLYTSSFLCHYADDQHRNQIEAVLPAKN